VRLAAGFAYGGAGASPARLTEIVQVEPGGRESVPIPPWAMSFAVVPDAALQLEVLTFGPGFSPKYIVNAPLSNQFQSNIENAFPLVNGARCIEVTNLSATNPLTAFVIFDLSF
jgi:hypothetical protein